MLELTPLDYALRLLNRPSYFRETVGQDMQYIEAIDFLRAA